jgi:hypothetical protein
MLSLPAIVLPLFLRVGDENKSFAAGRFLFQDLIRVGDLNLREGDGWGRGVHGVTQAGRARGVPKFGDGWRRGFVRFRGFLGLGEWGWRGLA